MQQLELVIHNETGLHARPAKYFVRLAKQYESTIHVRNGKKQVNAKSLISVLTLGVEHGDTLQIEVTGTDEVEAARALAEAIRDGLGEEVPGPAPQAAPPPPVAPPRPAPGLVDTTDATVHRGLPAAPGIAIGPLYQLRRRSIEVEDTFEGFSQEELRLNRAVEQARKQLATLRAEMATRAASEAAIFDVHLEILEDPELLDAVLDRIQARESAAHAWQQTIEARATAVAALGDPLLAARAADLHDVGYRVLRGIVGESGEQALVLPDYPVVLTAQDLSPSDTAALPPGQVLGFCTAAGGPTAHSAIIARALRLPAVVSTGEALLDLPDGTMVILDGSGGTLVVDPDQETLDRAREAQRQFQSRLAAAEQRATEPAVTEDGHHVEIVANIGGIADAEQAVQSGAEGVGLLRTEFLFLDRASPPTEDEQHEVYQTIAQHFGEHPVIVRTLDIGGDKPLPYIEVPHEENPFLGERGIRLCLNRPELLREQLRAILRAASAGNLRIMFPMISDIREFRRARAMVEEIRAELYAPQVEVGIMVEVPSAALMADAFAREVDFFSIGTNDLTQYTLAIDRMHPTMAVNSDGLHPAILRLIKQTVDAAHAQGKWVGVCGELGADPQAVPILVGLGVDELSVSVPSIATVKEQIRQLTMDDAQRIAERALACATAQEVRNL